MNVKVGSVYLPALTFSTLTVTPQLRCDGGAAEIWKIAVTTPVRTRFLSAGAPEVPIGEYAEEHPAMIVSAAAANIFFDGPNGLPLVCRTPALTCGPRRARALRFRGPPWKETSKARDRPGRQVHRVVRLLTIAFHSCRRTHGRRTVVPQSCRPDADSS